MVTERVIGLQWEYPTAQHRFSVSYLYHVHTLLDMFLSNAPKSIFHAGGVYHIIVHCLMLWTNCPMQSDLV